MGAFDYTSGPGSDGVELIVRPNNRYGAAGEGEVVRVDRAELKNPSTMSACMTLEEAEEIEAAREAARKDAEERRKKSSAVKTGVEAGLANLAQVGAAKAKARAEAAEFERAKAERLALEKAQEAREEAERAEKIAKGLPLKG